MYKSSSRTRALNRLFKELFKKHPHTSAFDVVVTIYGTEYKYLLLKDMDRNWVVNEED